MSRRIGGAVAVIVVALAALSSCSSDTTSSPTEATGAPTSTIDPAAEVRPAGPAADLSQELTGGNGVFVAAATPVDLAAAGYVEHEFVASGTATSYAIDGAIPPDGRAAARPDEAADYRTRVVVRRPADAAEFNGSVFVEWLNVSGGLDASPEFTATAEELLRSGAVWVGVSAQQIGVEGGPVLVSTIENDLIGKGLTHIDPTRYGSLQHPGDAFSYDIYTQVARALRENGSDGLGDLRPERIVAIGQSQSGFALTTYADAIQPLTRQFDGFLIHSRGSAPLPLASPPGTPADIASAIGVPPAIIRTDLGVPVLIVETETDVTSVLSYYDARQDNTADLRVWEVAGTAHADRSTMGSTADQMECGVEVNDGPQRFVVRAALRGLDTWVRTGEAPPKADRLEVTTASGSPVIVRDADGIALGGVRLPQVTVPVATLSGEKGPTGGVICMLLGTTVPFTPERLAALYPSAEKYLDAYTAATDDAVAAGFALPEDRQQILDDADPGAISG